MPKTYKLTIEFSFEESEPIAQIGDEIEQAVVDIVDPDCDGNLPCPREWCIVREILDC